jgi:hypothetical protein
MASQQAKSSQQINLYLSPNQQDLLLAALNSQTAKKTRAKAALGNTGLQSTSSDVSQPTSTTMSGTAVFQSPGNMDNFNPDFTPDLDYLDGDGSFDFENADLGGEMIGGLPGLDADGNPEQHDKRKNSDDDGSLEEGDAKRQELGEGEKGSKKPGRKPLTNEPTTVSMHFLLPDSHSSFLLVLRPGDTCFSLAHNALPSTFPIFPQRDGNQLLIFVRNVRRKIAPRNVRSGSARRNT